MLPAYYIIEENNLGYIEVTAASIKIPYHSNSEVFHVY